MSLSLARALRMDFFTTVAFIGSGGKTTAMFQLARELRKRREDSPVIVTTTTHLGVWQIGEADRHITAESFVRLQDVLEQKGVTLITGGIEDERARPISNDVLNRLFEACRTHAISLLIEADGSRQKPLKAWAEHEPPIPQFVQQVVQVAGLSGLQQPLQGEYVHRPEIFSSLSGLQLGERISPQALTRVLTHPQGGLKNIPDTARRVVLLNQADTSDRQSMARGMTNELLESYQGVIIASLRERMILAAHERAAAVVLAAGESSRFGKPKQLLDWKGQPFIRAVSRTALEAGLSPVVVVTGANAEQTEAAIRDLNVCIVRNESWKSGQGSSIRAGVEFLLQQEKTEGKWGSAIFLLVDQPHVTVSVLRALIERHAEGLSPIVAPMVADRRANPVLFDRVTFSDLLAIEGDVGGRAIFHKYPVEYLPWHDERLLLDVDTPEMYQRLIADDAL